MSEIHVFTSAASNYIPKVRLLFESLRRHHPEWRLHLALADELPDNLDPGHEQLDSVVPLRELGIPDWQGWSFCHQIVELATAIKPFMLARLLSQPGCRKVLYFDPDMVVFSRLDDIVAALDESNLVLTPHQTIPEASLGAVMDNEICSLRHGIYNLGFIGVAANEVGASFAEWWSQRLYHFCRDDIPNGLFTDQRWIDLVPAFFPGVCIMRSPRHNVATWNLTTRSLTRSPEGDYLVDGEPLGFYHFTGFDSGAHHLMAEKNPDCSAATRRLIRWYKDQARQASRDPLAESDWVYGRYSDGSVITPVQRQFYRDRADLQRKFPDPYEATGYLEWWRKHGDPDWNSARKPLTPGYTGLSEAATLGNVATILRRAVANPATGLAIGRRGWEVLRSEGLAGIKRRLYR